MKSMFIFLTKMAQMAQTAPRRNTNNIRLGNRSKSRNWCFTLNNYTEEEVKNLCDNKYQYIFQEETGAEGTPHLQGLICLTNPQALSYMKRINGRAHWEITRNKIASIQYCSKEETRTGKIYTNMKIADNFSTNGTARNDPRDSEEDLREIINGTNDDLWNEINVSGNMLLIQGAFEQGRLV